VSAPIASARRRVIRVLAVAITLCGAAGGLFACYLRLSATFPVGSDGASNALEAWALLHGNWLLRGWTLTDVSFYTTELPEYAAVELARGLNPGVVRVSAAVTYTLLIIVAAVLARGRARGREGWTRALIAAGIMIAPQLGNGVHVLLSQPDHVGTQVPVLGVFLLLDRAPRRWYTVAAAWALLTAAIVADKIAIVDAVVPLAFVGVLHATWAITPGAGRRAGRAAHGIGLTAGRLRSQWFELSLAAAAAAAAGTAALLIAGVSRLGGFAMLPVQTGMIAPGRLPANLALALHGTLTLFGADVTVAPAMAWLHAPCVALAVAAFASVVWRVPRRHDLVGDVLAVAIVVNLAGFVASIIPATAFDTREMAALLPFGAVLAGRIFGPRLAASPVAVGALALAGACQFAALGYEVARPPAADPELALAGWLAAHHLTSGLGTFNEDNVTTLDSGGTVRLATVSWRPASSPALCPQSAQVPASLVPRPCHDTAGGAVPRLYQSSASWYDPAAAQANFVVTGTTDGPADVIPRAEILGLAGPPARTYRFQAFTIMVWNENLLPLLGAPPAVTPGDIGHP